MQLSLSALLAACDRGTALDHGCKTDRDCPPPARCIPAAAVCVTTTIPHDAGAATPDIAVSQQDLGDLGDTILDQSHPLDIAAAVDIAGADR